MTGKNTDMQAIFSKLTERNKDIIILVAKSVKVAQDISEQPHKSAEHATAQCIGSHSPS